MLDWLPVFSSAGWFRSAVGVGAMSRQERCVVFGGRLGR